MLWESTKAVSDWTTEKYPPTFDKVKKISQIYDISIPMKKDKISCQYNRALDKYPKQEKDSFYEIIDKVTNTNQTLADGNKTLAEGTKELL